MSLGCEQAVEQINSTPPRAPPPATQPEQGATFSLATALRGDELQGYKYQVEIRDQSGCSISLPLKYSDGKVTLNEFKPAAGIRGRYDYRNVYFDPDTNEYIPIRQDNWAHFNVEHDRELVESRE